MKIVIQRTASSSIIVDGNCIADSKKPGLLVLVGFGKTDNPSLLTTAIEKIINLRIFPNERGRFDLSLLDINGDLTLVPQFTLYADTTKGRRPEFFDALEPDKAALFFENLVTTAQEKLGKERVQRGQFGADMKVSLLNDGPVTILLDL